MFDKYQQAIIEHYANGECSGITTMEEAEEYGDGLLVFLLRESAETEDCSSFSDVLDRILCAVSQLEDLAACIDAEYVDD